MKQQDYKGKKQVQLKWTLAFKSPICEVRLAVKPRIIASLTACKKSAPFINSFLRKSRFYSPMT